MDDADEFYLVLWRKSRLRLVEKIQSVELKTVTFEEGQNDSPWERAFNDPPP